MRKAAVLVALALTAVTWAGPSAAHGGLARAQMLTAASAPRAPSAPGTPGTRLWLARFSGPGNSVTHDDIACCVAVSPNGKLVFVTGYSTGKLEADYLTIAYNAVTGAMVWRKRYVSSHALGSNAASIAVGPRGDKVFVTGTGTGKISGQDYITVAYRAGTGATLWVRRYNGPGNGSDQATSVAVSPGGGKIFVTGGSTGKGTMEDYATVAYSASSGATLWVKRYNGPGDSHDQANSVAVSPGGGRVFITGYSMGKGGPIQDYATIAYRASTGARLWLRRYNGPGNSTDVASSLAVSPSGDRVFVTGSSDNAYPNADYTTFAYSAATGATVWTQTYNGPGNGYDAALAVAASPNGNSVVVTGSSASTSSEDLTTIAYGAATGAPQWTQRYSAPGANPSSEGRSVAFSPDGSTVYVTGGNYATGSLWDYRTVAYSAATGAMQWQKGYNGPFSNNDEASSVAVSRITGAVYVTGGSMGSSTSGEDYTTIAYRG